MGPLANLIVLAGIAGFRGPEPMAPYLALGWSKSTVLSSSRFRVLRLDHCDHVWCWWKGAGTLGVSSGRCLHKNDGRLKIGWMLLAMLGGWVWEEVLCCYRCCC